MSAHLVGNRYAIGRELGRGRTGVVSVAHDVTLERDVAIREVTLPDGASARRFVAAVARSGTLGHPSIVSVYHVFDEDDTAYVVSELVEGGSLRSRVGLLTLPQLVGALEQLLGALAYAHARDVLHLDLGPGNVLVTSDGRVKLADFGIAEALRAEGVSDAGPWSDLRALGTTAYELVVGWPPFPDVPPVTILGRYRIDPRLSAWIGRLLETEPGAPSSRAEDARDELDAIAVGMLGSNWAAEARLPPLRGSEALPDEPDIAAPPSGGPLRDLLRHAAASGVVPVGAAAPTPPLAVPPPEYSPAPEAPPPPPPAPGASVGGSQETSAPPKSSPPTRWLWSWVVAPLLVAGAAAAAAKWLLGLLVEPGDAAATAADVVDCTVFAPPSARPGAAFLVQVFAHLPEEADDATAIASELDLDARRRAFRSLQAPVRVGSRLQFELRLGDAFVPDPIASLVWRRRTEAVQFEVRLPADIPVGTVIGTVTISRDSVPLGHVKFKVEIEHQGAERQSEPQGEDARRYRFAFVSYSSKDRDEVLRRVQLLPLLGIEYFQDVLSLDPGDRWSRRIELGIDRCDLFLLFWSSDAKASEWVRREARYALTRKGGDDLLPPEIRPVVLEGPPIVEPWEELAHLHFGDRHLYFIRER